MEEKILKITKIEGDYAYLREIGTEEEELFIAMALLPQGADEGSSLRLSGFEFELLE